VGVFPDENAPVVCVSRLFQRVVFVISAAIFTALGLGYWLGEIGWLGVHASGQQDGAYRQIRVYQQVLSHIQSDYVTEPKMGDVTTGALRGLLESLDADSSYLTPTEYKIYKQRPTTGIAQVGMVVSKRYGYAAIVTILPGSPADKEHLADGDVIESIGDQSTRELSLGVIRLLLEGKPGTTVTLSVVRPRKSEPDKITLTRAEVPAPALVSQPYESNSILYIKPWALTAARVDEVAAKIKAAGPGRKILLDLRDSAGGEMDQGLRLANFFLKQGTLATLEGQKFPKQTFTADPAKMLTEAPLTVLVNRGTYGPAELAAAALGDAKRGDVVGERTFGEGAVQKTFELPDGSALLLTVAKYQSPAGKKIEDEAVTPSVLVGPSADEEDDAVPAKTDEPLAKALNLLKAKTV
jgi:carboxyl-terminal processing protease